MIKNNIIKKVFLLLVSVIMFVAANPNFLNNQGLSILAFFYFVPVFVLIRYCSLKRVWIYGGFYGALSYGLYAYWLYSFDPLCLVAVCAAYFIFYAIIFILLKLCDLLFKKNGYIMQWLCICSFEYLKTKGFLGFSYGVTAYTQWNNPLLIQITDIIGPYGFSAFILFCSAFITSIILKLKDRRRYFYEKHIDSVEKVQGSNITNYLQEKKLQNLFSLNGTAILFAVWSVLFLAFVVYGKIKVNKPDNCNSIKVVAIQSNESPWKNGIDEQTKDIQRLISLTDEALELNPDVKIIVWPETAVVPAIVYNYEEKKDERRYELVNLLLNYINSKEATFVIGNGHKVKSLKPVLDVYNSALVFTPGKNVIPPTPKVYSKMKLVPFSESFPYSKYFPNFYRFLLKKNTHMWTPGNKIEIFKLDDLFFSTPICFEDTFPDVCRKMAGMGSRCFINLSNDSWSKSEACQNQHLAMAIFRCVENGVPAVRSTTSGQTCIINKNGKITEICTPFASSYVVGNVFVVPQYEKGTLYNKIGDVFGIIPVIVFLILLIIRGTFVIIKKSSE